MCCHLEILKAAASNRSASATNAPNLAPGPPPPPSCCSSSTSQRSRGTSRGAPAAAALPVPEAVGSRPAMAVMPISGASSKACAGHGVSA